MAIIRVIKDKRKRVDIIELGKGLFRRGGAILMPGKLGTDDGPKDEASDKAELLKKAGIKALAAVFKQFEFDNRKRLVIAGHADDGKGGTKEKFDLSALRAKGVFYLLKGEANPWADLCYKNHTVEDVQRILKFFHVCMGGWDCDPKAINGTWSDDVFKATGKFVSGYDAAHATTKIPPAILDTLKKDPKKLWPVELWLAVFRLFEEEMCTALKITPPAKLPRVSLTFVQAGMETVACGESFPLKEADSKYKTTSERKVDLVFYKAKEAPGVHPPGVPFRCAAPGPIKHVWELCPIWRQKKTILVRYIDPEKDLNSIAYHLGFDYFNDIAGGVRRVPEGLVVNAYEYVKTAGAKTKTKTKIVGQLSFSAGVYTLVIPDDSARTNLHFEFEAKDKDDAAKQLWVFTKDKTTSPELVAETPAEIAKLTLPDKAEERFKYYDLPREWSSENYWTRYMGDDGKWKGNRYLEVMKNEKKLKPYPPKTATTTAGKPLIFSLDDIVLVDKNGDQNINAVGNKAGDKRANNEKIALSGSSRVSILHVENGDLVLYNPLDANAPYFSKNSFRHNLIVDVPQGTRMVIFANDFYSVYDKRAGQGGWSCVFARNHVKGCRAAKLEESDSHFGMRLRNTSGGPGTLYYARACGNFELHYVHNGCPITDPPNLKVRSFLIVYWNGVFVASNLHGKPHNVNAADVRKYRILGLLNSKTRWEDKGYTIEPHAVSADGRGKVQIKPVFFFEAKLNDVGGKPKCTVKITNNNKDGEMGITDSKMYYLDYQDRDYLGVGDFTDIDGKKYATLTVAHEVGHAIGKMDDYPYSAGELSALKDAVDGKFCQWYLGMPYQDDEGSMMRTNRAPRTRYIWFFVNRLNDAAANNVELKPLLNGTTYEVVHRYGSGAGKKTLKFFLPSGPNDYRNIHVPFKPNPRAPAATSSKVDGATPACAGTGQVDLFLYKLGDDEYARNIEIAGIVKNFAFDGILVVFIKMNYQFVDVGTHKWNKPTRLKWMQDVSSELILLNNSYYLECTGASDFKRTLLLFFPVGLTAAATGSHYTIRVSRNALKGVTRHAGKKEIRLGGKVSSRWVARYVLGHDGGEAVVHDAAVPVIGKSDLLFARDWLNAQLGGGVNFVIKDV